MADREKSQMRALGVLLAILVLAVGVQAGYMIHMSHVLASVKPANCRPGPAEASCKQCPAKATCRPAAPKPAPQASAQPQPMAAPMAPQPRPIVPVTPQPQPIVPATPQPRPTAPIAPRRWNPYEEMRRMQAEMDHIFECAFGRSRGIGGMSPISARSSPAPSLDVRDEGDKYVFSLNTPGDDQPDIQVDVKDQVVTITGKQDRSEEQKDKDGRLIRKEHRVGQFERSFRLPEPVDAAKMETKRENGVFTITLPKAQIEDNQG